jgi:hypothetical protein
LALACGYDQSHLTRESNNSQVVRRETYALLTAENAAAAVQRGRTDPVKQILPPAVKPADVG